MFKRLLSPNMVQYVSFTNMTRSPNRSFQVSFRLRFTDAIIQRPNAKAAKAIVNALHTAIAVTVSFDLWISLEAQNIVSSAA